MKYNTDYPTEKCRSFPANTCEYIMLHHTWAGKGINIVKYLANNPKKVSCHFVVDTDGTVYKLADPRKVTWHAGESSYEGRVQLNLYSIGIEVVSDGHKFTDEQREVVKELVKTLMKEYKIPSSKVIRHKDVAPGRKRDIGDNFRNNQFSSFAEYQRSFDQKEAPKLHPEAEEARKLGIRNGLDPDKPATREQVAMMVMRMIKVLSE